MKKSSGDWEILVNHRSDLLTQHLILTGIYKYAHLKEFGFTFDFPYILYDHASGNIYWKANQVAEMAANLLSISQYRKLIAGLERSFNEYKKFVAGFKKNRANVRRNPAIIGEYFRQSQKAAASVAQSQLEKVFSKKLVDEGIPPEAIHAAKTDTTRAVAQLQRITQKFRNELKKNSLSRALEKELKTFCKRFGYLGMKYFLGHPWTVWEAYEMLKGSGGTPKKDVKNNRQYRSPYLPFIKSLLRIRTERYELMCYSTSLFREMIMTYCADFIFYDELLYLTPDEIVELFRRNFPQRKIIEQRKSFTLELTDSGCVIKAALSPPPSTPTRGLHEVFGVVAYPGIISGRVKIVLSPKESAHVERGDILVTTTSTPDFLPAMIRAAAFVTDIGGITSHAAIVAREMKKPCVIGTKIATKVFKDGDLIEVDADKGVVRKIL